MNTNEALNHYHKANGVAVAMPHGRERLSMRVALPLWLGLGVGGWLIVGMLFKLLVG